MFYPAISGHRPHTDPVYPLSQSPLPINQAEPLLEIRQGPEITWWSNYICECLLGNINLEAYDEGELWQKMTSKLKEEKHPNHLKYVLSKFYGDKEEVYAYQMGAMAAYYLKEALIQHGIYTREYCVMAYLQSTLFFHENPDSQNLVFMETFSKSLLFSDMQGYPLSITSKEYEDPIFACICPILTISRQPHPLLSVIKNRALLFLAQPPETFQYNPFFSAKLLSAERRPTLQVRLNTCSLLMPLKSLSVFNAEASYFYQLGDERELYFHLEKSLYFPVYMSEQSVLAKHRDLFQGVGPVEIKHVITAKFDFERNILSAFIHNMLYDFEKCLGMFVELSQSMPQQDLQALFKYCSHVDQEVFNFYLHFLLQEQNPHSALFAWMLSLTCSERYAPFVIDLWDKIVEDNDIQERYAFGYRLLERLCINKRFEEAAYVLLDLSTRGQIKGIYLRQIEGMLHKQSAFANPLSKVLEKIWPLAPIQNGILEETAITQPDTLMVSQATPLKRDEVCMPFLAPVKLLVDLNTGKSPQSSPDMGISELSSPKRDAKFLSQEDKMRLRIKQTGEVLKNRQGSLSFAELREYISLFFKENKPIEELKKWLLFVSQLKDSGERDQLHDCLIQQFDAFAVSQMSKQDNEGAIREILYCILSQCLFAKISFFVLEPQWQAILRKNPHQTLRKILGLLNGANKKTQESARILLFGLKLLDQHTPQDAATGYWQLLNTWPNQELLESPLLQWIEQPDFNVNKTTLKIVNDLWMKHEGIEALFSNKPDLTFVRSILLNDKKYAKSVQEKLVQFLKNDRAYLNVHGLILSAYYSYLPQDFFTAARNPHHEIALLMRPDVQIADWQKIYTQVCLLGDKTGFISFWSVVWCKITQFGHREVLLSDSVFLQAIIANMAGVAPEALRISYQNIEPLKKSVNEVVLFVDLKSYILFLHSLSIHLPTDKSDYFVFSALLREKLSQLAGPNDFELKSMMGLWIKWYDAIFCFRGISDVEHLPSVPIDSILRGLMSIYSPGILLKTLAPILTEYAKSGDDEAKKRHFFYVTISSLIGLTLENGGQEPYLGLVFNALNYVRVHEFLHETSAMLAQQEQYYTLLLLLPVLMRGYKIKDDQENAKIFSYLEKAVQETSTKCSPLIINCLIPEWLSPQQIKSLLLQIKIPTDAQDLQEYLFNWDVMQLFCYLKTKTWNDEGIKELEEIVMNKYINLLEQKFSVLLNIGLNMQLKPRSQFQLICFFFEKAQKAFYEKCEKPFLLDDLVEFLQKDFFQYSPSFLPIFNTALKQNDDVDKKRLGRLYTDIFRLISFMADTNQYAKDHNFSVMLECLIQMQRLHKKIEIDDFGLLLHLYACIRNIYRKLGVTKYDSLSQNIFKLASDDIIKDIYSKEPQNSRDISLPNKVLEVLLGQTSIHSSLEHTYRCAAEFLDTAKDCGFIAPAFYDNFLAGFIEKLEQQHNPVLINAAAQGINGQILRYIRMQMQDAKKLALFDRWMRMLETDAQQCEMPLNLAKKLKERW